jgi:peptidyl-prolyl cis-trans isomerase A (cyclophilin A)
MGYFDQTFFHRVVPNFIIQGGNSDNISTSRKRKALGNNYRLPSEVNPGRKHRYGTVSGAKEYRKNKEKMSAPYEFFIFLGPDTSTRHLNGEYTIFGQVIHGMDVVETIANLPTDSGEWPKTNVFIEAKIIN